MPCNRDIRPAFRITFFLPNNRLTLFARVSLHMKSILLLSNGFASLVSSLLDTETHSHHAIQIVIGLSGDFEITINNSKISGSGIIIRNDIPHQIALSLQRTENFQKSDLPPFGDE